MVNYLGKLHSLDQSTLCGFTIINTVQKEGHLRGILKTKFC